MSKPGTTQDSIRRHLLAGVAGMGCLLVGVGSWAATAQLAGAVVVPGFLVVKSDVKKVQHPTGGVVARLAVHDGDYVRAGDVLIRLDDTVPGANLAIVCKALDEATAREARLTAERDGSGEPAFPEELKSRRGDPAVAGVMAGEQKLFKTRQSARDGQKSQLHERIAQIREQVQGLTEQIDAKKKELDLIGQELTGVRQLWEKKLVPIQRVNALERDLARLEGEKGALVSTIAQAKAKITETELQIMQIDQDLRMEVGKDLADTRSKMAELVERKVTAEDQLKRIDVRSPQDGIVHQLSVHTVGGVISPGEQIMMIVPTDDQLTVETKIQPQDRERVYQGQATRLRFTSFNQRTTPEIEGIVDRVSPDLSSDPRTGQSSYTARIGIPTPELAKLGQEKIYPGMPVDAFIQTRPRTVFSYLTKPLADQINRAFREE